MLKISVSMIVLNEERNIGRALASCSFADEIVVVDGGSTDRTMDILGQDPRVVPVRRQWGGHFGEQRQASLARCTGDWVIRLDADEAFSDELERGIRPLLEGFPSDVSAGTIRQCNLVGSESFYSKTFDVQETVPRLWRIRPGIRWEGNVHERPVGIEGKVASIDAYVVHYGFLDRNRYGEKGSFYSQIPGSGFRSREELLFREYDIQPRPARSAVGKRVPPYASEERRREPGRPRIAIVRGPNLSLLEMRNYEPLTGEFDLTAYTTATKIFDMGGATLPVVKMPSDPSRPGYMEGLEFALFHEDLIYSADSASMFSYQASVIKEKFGKKLVCLQWESIPFAHEESNEMRELKAAVRKRTDHFIATTERAREALVLEGVDPERITVIPMGIDTDWFRPDDTLRDSCRQGPGISPDGRFDSGTVAKRVGEVLAKVLEDPARPADSPRRPDVSPPPPPSNRCAAEDALPGPGAGTSPTPVVQNKDPGYFQKERREVEAMVPPGASRILDVGCGEGILGRTLLEKGAAEVVGIETNPAVALRAQANLSRVLQGDVESLALPFEEGYFDCIVLADVLEHLRDPLSALVKLKRHLSDSGAIVASIPNVRFFDVIRKLAEGRWEYEEFGILDKTHLRFFTKKEIEVLFSQAGLELTGISENLSPLYYKLPPAHSGDVSFGRVTLHGLTREETKDLFVIQYLIVARKADSEARGRDRRVSAALESGDLESARSMLEEFLEEHPLDADALLRHSDLCSRLGSREEALADLDKILLFHPERKDALVRKAALAPARLAQG
ncbi:MAG: methyltransferase domain-containing protein [bacterium]|jgi:2-polyprenyl-3-methyl-5-hydroxy-6-metoxy-1,4-benzoquinol methylase